MSNSTPSTPPEDEQTEAVLHEGCFAEDLAEFGWTPKYMPLDPTGRSAGVVPVGVAGHNDRYFVGPNYLHPERGCMLQDHVRGVYMIVRDVPTPCEAAKLLAKHGMSFDATRLPSWGRQQRSS